jgi:enamine deaminase RidA (YjgF/YER057c/UK114 family)
VKNESVSGSRDKRRVVPNVAPWGQSMRYARAMRVGNVIEVSGTTAVDSDGDILCPGDVAGQVRTCFRIIQQSLEELDSCLEDIVRTRVFVTDIETWPEAGTAHDEVLGHVAPVSSLVAVAALLHPQVLVEIEVSAIAGSAAIAAPSQTGKALS